MNSLIQSRKIEVKKSKIHGYGVFATDNIFKGEILEECHFMSIPYIKDIAKEYKGIFNYPFLFPIENPTELAWPFGYGCIYNSSKNCNADWCIDSERRLFIFTAIKDIKKGEEICTNYEDNVDWVTKNI
tara:strand:- start:628 stop:1014 length:387 start_codon:yes stop_codon:yes gene_type:complete